MKTNMKWNEPHWTDKEKTKMKNWKKERDRTKPVNILSVEQAKWKKKKRLKDFMKFQRKNNTHTCLHERPTELYFICNNISQSLDARQFALHIVFDTRSAFRCSMFNAQMYVNWNHSFSTYILHFKWKTDLSLSLSVWLWHLKRYYYYLCFRWWIWVSTSNIRTTEYIWQSKKCFGNVETLVSTMPT